MSFTITADAFTDEEDAVAKLEARGCAVVVRDVADGGADLHWHDFEAITAVLSGRITVTDTHGVTAACGPGQLLEAPARTLHTEVVEAGRVVFGFPDGFPARDQPIDRDPADHPDRA